MNLQRLEHSTYVKPLCTKPFRKKTPCVLLLFHVALHRLLLPHHFCPCPQSNPDRRLGAGTPNIASTIPEEIVVKDGTVFQVCLHSVPEGGCLFTAQSSASLTCLADLTLDNAPHIVALPAGSAIILKKPDVSVCCLPPSTGHAFRGNIMSPRDVHIAKDAGT